jgi:GntR family transcriptional regulator
MKLWLSKNSEISVKDQIVAQVRVAVVAGDLTPGDRLPSTREIARRFGLHPNTVSAAYRELARNAEVEKRSGSGVFVAESNGRADVLDRLVDDFLKNVESHGFAKADVVERLNGRNQASGEPDLALFEPDQDLAEIIVHELSRAGARVSIVGPDSVAAAVDSGLRLIAMADEKPKLAKLLTDDCDRIFLSANSVALSMAGQKRPSNDEVVAIVSAWGDFLTFARLFLIAAKIDRDSIVTVSTKDRGWKSKLRAASVIICDSVVASKLENDERVRAFPLIAASSIDQLTR